MSKTTPEDHLIILRELLAGNKTLAMSSSIRARVNCSHVSVKLHLSCTVCDAQGRLQIRYKLSECVMTALLYGTWANQRCP